MMTTPDIHSRMRTYLQGIAAQGVPITYQALAVALELAPPKTIHQVTEALEVLMAEDVAAGRPMIAALVISKSGTGLPAVGFFEMAARLGRFEAGIPTRNLEIAFWETEIAAVVKSGAA
jgi:hypothetical protein